MTVQELEESYMFRIIKRSIMKEYPWVKDVKIDQEDFENYKRVVFLNLSIDPYELGQEKDWEVASWVRNEPHYEGSTIGMFFRGRNDEYHELNDEMNTTIEYISDSPAIPDDLRLKTTRNSFSIGNFISVT